MAYLAVLFDLDGTLLDTLGDLADSVNAALTSLGHPTHPVDAYKTFVGNGMEMLMRRALPEEIRDNKSEVEVGLSRLADEYSRRWGATTRPYPGVPELLSELQDLEVKVAVVTNKTDEFAKKTVKMLLPRGSVHLVIGAQPGLPLKPDPTGVLQAAKSFGMGPSHFVYLGDSGVDMQTAKNAGMLPVGALWGFRSREELVQSGAVHLIEHPLELMPIIVG